MYKHTAQTKQNVVNDFVFLKKKRARAVAKVE